MILKKSLYLLLCFVFLTAFGFGEANAQGRARIVKQTSSQPTTQPQTYIDKTKTTVISQPTSQRPTLTNDISVKTAQNQQLVKKTASSLPTNAAANNSNTNRSMMYSMAFTQRMYSSIQSKIGIPYRYGSEGPNSYDCSAFVWKVFQEAGMVFERSSARTYYANFEPVYGDDRYRFGTLVFFNSLGHVGIVADKNGFYQASSSKGITYTPFAGYWEKRIVGFRRVPVNVNF
ncbi:MAG: C40 family peptidase [Pyrinomonadaceae bacterium]